MVLFHSYVSLPEGIKFQYREDEEQQTSGSLGTFKLESVARSPLMQERNLPMAMTQDPIDWRYRFHIFLAYVSLNFREYPQKIWPNI